MRRSAKEACADHLRPAPICSPRPGPAVATLTIDGYIHVPHAGAKPNPHDVITFLCTSVAGLKALNWIELAVELPRDAVGKVLRRGLRRKLEGD